MIKDWNKYTGDLYKEIDKNIIDKYINILNKDDLNENKNIEIININEYNYNIKIKEITELYNNTNEIDNIKKTSSLNILKKELEIIKLLTKYFLQNKIIEYNFIIISLKLLLILSEHLRIRINQKKIINKNNNNILKRSSYKFCLYKQNCMYNYNKKCKYICYQDHYVHNMVSYDLELLINYINNNNENNNNDNKEILKTLNTLNYVIAHMESELKTKCLYIKDENEYEQYHIINKKLS